MVEDLAISMWDDLGWVNGWCYGRHGDITAIITQYGVCFDRQVNNIVYIVW